MMNLTRIASRCVVAALLAQGALLGPDYVSAFQRDPPFAEEGVEVLTRGPVHEAFAGTITFNPAPGIVVPRAPPETIDEVSPEQRLAGDNVDWIPGYWAWDDERNDFLWVSGIWRKLPPGRQWVPGYWGQAGPEFQWTSGFWANATASDVEYLPEPPASVEEGPNIAPTSPDQSWIPGCWQWRESRYDWRPGFWSAAQPDWIWVPGYYTWSPRGYVFVDGYWDHAVARRGVLFAPVYFNSGIRSRRGYSYSPSTVISTSALISHLFLRQNSGHYYFGDYYASNYSGLGFSPWFVSHSSRHGYDPIYAHERWHHRNDRQWDRRVEADFERRRDREDARPPRTWAAQRALVSRRSAPDTNLLIAGSLDQMTRSKGSPLRFQPVDKSERQRLAQQKREIQEFRQERQRLEARSPDRSVANPSQTSDPLRMKLRRSPFVSRSADQMGKDQAPTRREALKPEVQVKPHRSRTVESKPFKLGRSSANRRTQDPDENRSSVPPRHTANRQPATPQPRVERSVRRPQQQRELDQPAPAERIDRAAQQPQTQSRSPRQTRVKRTPSQPMTDRPAPPPRVGRRVPQPRVKQPRAPADRPALQAPLQPQASPKENKN